MKKIISAILCVCLCLSAIAPIAFAERRVITDPLQREAVLYDFNSKVNAIKTERPACEMKTDYVLATPTLGSYDGEAVDENAAKWLKWIVDSFFKQDSGLANKLFSTIFGAASQPKEYSFAYGEKRTNRVPVSGKDYVSAIDDDDVFSVVTETLGGSKLHPENAKDYTRFIFYDTPLAEAEDSVLAKVFNLTKGELNPVIVSETYVDPQGRSGKNALDGIVFDDFTFTDAYALMCVGSSGLLESYETYINYRFTLSLYDFIRLVSAFFGFNFMNLAETIAVTISGNTGKGARTPEEVMRSRCIYFNYSVRTTISSFDWMTRCFGDVDGKDGLTVNDARAALRHAVGIQEIRNQTALMYGDMDFDGDITVTDARLILRAAIGLDESFTKVPEGETVKIVDVEAEPDPIEEQIDLSGGDTEIPGPGEPGETGEEPGENESDISGSVADFIQSIFDIVSAVREDDGESGSAIDDLINYIKSLSEDN